MKETRNEQLDDLPPENGTSYNPVKRGNKWSEKGTHRNKSSRTLFTKHLHFSHGPFDKGSLEDKEYESKLTNQLGREHDYTALET